MKFDKQGRLWIQTDGKYSNKGEHEGMGNNTMLVANSAIGGIHRFLSGPVACEMTCISFIPDDKIMTLGTSAPKRMTSPPAHSTMARLRTVP